MTNIEIVRRDNNPLVKIKDLKPGTLFKYPDQSDVRLHIGRGIVGDIVRDCVCMDLESGLTGWNSSEYEVIPLKSKLEVFE